MTDSKKLTLLIGKIDTRFDKIDARLDNLELQVSSLQEGQIGIRKDIKEMDIKVSYTYQLALDAWGSSKENRKWLEKGSLPV